jgi:succinate dehydrogenase / fumarate reductase cytochrome b subunit
MSTQTRILPKSFVLSRLHSLTGLWIVLFLIEHLLTNSQAALFLGEDGIGFIRMVNLIKSLPYLEVVEVVLIGVPILYHAALGIHYAIKGRSNVVRSDGSKPSLQYTRNLAYTVQRLSAWILLVGLIAHVAFMRFAIYPTEAKEGNQKFYFVRLSMDQGLYTVADRLGVKLYDQQKIQEQNLQLQSIESKIDLVQKRLYEVEKTQVDQGFSQEKMSIYESLQRLTQKKEWILALGKRPILQNQVIAVSKDFGTATLLNVRDAFKSPLKIGLYTVFVLAACFHAFNGLWTFMMTWGAMITVVAQKKVLRVCVALMILLAFLGLSSIWGTYLMNLKS